VAGAIGVVAGAAAQPEGVTAAHDDAPTVCIEFKLSGRCGYQSERKETWR
jgi:hypothetical protein